jgi:hypothetical protein
MTLASLSAFDLDAFPGHRAIDRKHYATSPGVTAVNIKKTSK